jgi:outer membrane protein TolC
MSARDWSWPLDIRRSPIARRSHIAALMSTLLLGACASLSPDGGMSVPAEIAAQHLRKDVVAIRNDEDADAAAARVNALLKRPLTADNAVQVALLNNRGLQAAYNELGIADAVRLRETLPPNPSLSITRLAGAAERELDRQIVVSILALATLPARTEIANERFRQAQLTAALETLRVGTEARRAFYRAVAAKQLVALLAHASTATETSAELAKRLGESGAMNKLDQARQQVLHADLVTELGRARQRESAERERLVRVLGLSGPALTLPSGLPPLPKRMLALPSVEQETINQRVDLQIARSELGALAKSYGLTKATRFINALEAGPADKITDNKETGEHAHSRGFTLTLEVPIFDFGESRAREAEQTYMQAVNRLAQKAIDARSQAREAYRGYRLSYDIAARYQRDVLPLRKIISDETMLRYGAMQVDVFTLLTEARQKINANVAAVEAQRDFWLASTELSAAISGGGSSSETIPSTAARASNDAGGH